MKPNKLKFPVIQLAVDITDADKIDRLFERLKPLPDRVIVEAGTPLIKKYGIGIVKKLKDLSGNSFIVADMKTLDVGSLEVDIAAEGGADAAVVAGLAPVETIEAFTEECHKKGMTSIMDSLGSSDLASLLPSLKIRPDVILFHRGIDEEDSRRKRVIENINWPMRAIAGGLTGEEIAKMPGFDIYVVGRYLTASSDPKLAMTSLIKTLEGR